MFNKDSNYLLFKVWDVVLDLSAPKLLIPDHFTDKSAALVVIDFGNLFVRQEIGEHGMEWNGLKTLIVPRRESCGARFKFAKCSSQLIMISQFHSE